MMFKLKSKNLSAIVIACFVSTACVADKNNSTGGSGNQSPQSLANSGAAPSAATATTSPAIAPIAWNTQGGGGTRICLPSGECFVSDLFIKGLGESFELSEETKVNMRSVRALLERYKIYSAKLWDEQVFGVGTEYRFVANATELPCEEGAYLHLEIDGVSSEPYGCTLGPVTYLAAKEFADLKEPRMQLIGLLHEKLRPVCGNDCYGVNTFLITEFLKGLNTMLEILDRQQAGERKRLSDAEIKEIVLMFKRAVMIKLDVHALPLQLEGVDPTQRRERVVIWPNGGGIVDGESWFMERTGTEPMSNPQDNVNEFVVADHWNQQDFAQKQAIAINNIFISIGSGIWNEHSLYEKSRILIHEKSEILSSQLVDSDLGGGTYEYVDAKCANFYLSAIRVNPNAEIFQNSPIVRIRDYNLNETEITNSVFRRTNREDLEECRAGSSNLEISKAKISDSIAVGVTGENIEISRSEVINLSAVDVVILSTPLDKRVSVVKGGRLRNARVIDSNLKCVSNKKGNPGYFGTNPFTGSSNRAPFHIENPSEITHCSLEKLLVGDSLICQNSELSFQGSSKEKAFAYGELSLVDSKIQLKDSYISIRNSDSREHRTQAMHHLRHHYDIAQILIAPNTRFENEELSVDIASVEDLHRDWEGNFDVSEASFGAIDERFQVGMRKYNPPRIPMEVFRGENIRNVYEIVACKMQFATIDGVQTLYRMDKDKDCAHLTE